ncbi:MAG: hypothetical protein HHJ17_18295 [Rhodoferax sp.]|uniref:hypothetical protein n=1 Tax=Rhodoferax sp. TaxID=50421 RepID=UPI00179B841A|nr:hypothetical protein [Rhodoferax sp.]NMM15473.1 hypothetical protein [Rhodoferax sp.]
MNTETNQAVYVTILKTASCPSLSGKSTLTYNVGGNAASEIQFQLLANDGGGYFNNDWIPYVGIQEVLNQLPNSQEITSSTLRSIYPSKSTNSPGFLLAVLKSLGLVRTLKTNRRCYELIDPSAFMAEVNALLESAPDIAMAATANANTGGRKLTLKDKPMKVKD